MGRKENARKYYEANKDKVIAKAKQADPEKRKQYKKNWLAKRPDYFKEDHLKRKYGITMAEWKVMFENQEGLCLICKKNEATDVDHCHDSQQIRGLLCNPCNRAIGLLRHDIPTLQNAVAYLEK